MKSITVLIVCGGLEPGRNGVGDYSKSFALSLIQSGIQVKIVSLFDKVEADDFKIVQENQDGVEVVRIPAGKSAVQRYKHLQSLITDFEPAWVSLQFVLYSFNPKGLPFKLSYQLRKLSGDFKWHIMFHELWIGTDHKLNLKNELLKRIQKYLVFELLQQLKPHYITTSIPFYASLLKGYDVDILPVFSNIPFYSKEHLVRDNPENSFNVVYFGSYSQDLHLFEKQLNFINAFSKRYPDARKQFISLGSGGVFAEQSLNKVKELCVDFSIKVTGILDQDEVSRLLQNSHMGISRAGHLLFGKSSSTLTMLEHGLPVLLKGSRHAGLNASRFEHLLVFADEPATELTYLASKPILPEVIEAFIKRIGSK